MFVGYSAVDIGSNPARIYLDIYGLFILEALIFRDLVNNSIVCHKKRKFVQISFIILIAYSVISFVSISTLVSVFCVGDASIVLFNNTGIINQAIRVAILVLITSSRYVKYDKNYKKVALCNQVSTELN